MAPSHCEVHAAARQEGIQPRTLRRAREALGILSRREGFGRGGHQYWQLPDDDATYAHLRERMQADLAAGGWRYQEGIVPDDDGATPYLGGAAPSVDVAPTVDSVPRGDTPMPETVRLGHRLEPGGRRVLLRRPIGPRTPPAEGDSVRSSDTPRRAPILPQASKPERSSCESPESFVGTPYSGSREVRQISSMGGAYGPRPLRDAGHDVRESTRDSN